MILCNIKNNMFNSFYIKGIHEDEIFERYESAKESGVTDEDNIFFEISDGRYKALIDDGRDIVFMNGELVNFEYPKKPDVYVNVVFDFKQLKWIELATQEEVTEHQFELSKNFYNSELEFASKATTELACGIIDQVAFEEVKTYMKSIDPYAGIKTIPEVKRPEIFKKYL